MTRLLALLPRDMRSEDFALAELGGARHRYRRFGCGNALPAIRGLFHASTLVRAAEGSIRVLPPPWTSDVIRSTWRRHQRCGSGHERTSAAHARLMTRIGWRYPATFDRGEISAHLARTAPGGYGKLVVFGYAGTEPAVLALLQHAAQTFDARSVRVDPWGAT